MERKTRWRRGGFLDNFASAVDALGVENIPIAWGMAYMQWDDLDERDRFYESVANKKYSEAAGGDNGESTGAGII